MSVPVREGELVGAKYRVERTLGIGGMGMVVAATHIELDQPVALKLMLPKALQHSGARERFLREARAAVRLKGEHVARVFDVGALETGTPYIVMEYLEGRDLQSRLDETGRLPVTEAVDLVLQACEALAEAHALGIVHRDLKPENLFLTVAPDGGPLLKVLDFGISKWKTEADKTLTAGASVMGSPRYMSPEQMKSTRDVDARTDIWSLGVILHQIVSGQLPFDADSVPELVTLVTTTRAPKLAEPGLPPGFVAVVYRCLEHDRSNRFADVTELAAALAPFGGDGAVERATRIAKVVRAKSTPKQTESAARPGVVVGADAPRRVSPDQSTVGVTPVVAGAPTPRTRMGSLHEALRKPPLLLLALAVLLAIAVLGVILTIASDRGADRGDGPRASETREAADEPAVPPAGPPPAPEPRLDAPDAPGKAPPGSVAADRPIAPPAPAPAETRKRLRRAKARPAVPPDDDVFQTRR